MSKSDKLLNEIVDAWEVLSGGRQVNVRNVEVWLNDDMKPVMDKIRKHLNREIPPTPLDREG